MPAWSFLLMLLVPSLISSRTANASVISSLPPAIIGTYIVTFALVSVPKQMACGLVPEQYAGSILPPDPLSFPGLEDGYVPIFVELGREANTGPPGLNIESFQEAKIEVPNVQRLEETEAPFLYKRWIAVDNEVDVIGPLYQFGLNTTKEVFSPSNSSHSSSFDYSIVGALNASFETIENTVWSLQTFQDVGGLPWFAEYLACAQHFYDWDSASSITYLNGSVMLYPPYVEQATAFPAQAIHGVFGFEIKGPLPCETFVD